MGLVGSSEPADKDRLCRLYGRNCGLTPETPREHPQPSSRPVERPQGRHSRLYLNLFLGMGGSGTDGQTDRPNFGVPVHRFVVRLACLLSPVLLLWHGFLLFRSRGFLVLSTGLHVRSRR